MKLKFFIALSLLAVSATAVMAQPKVIAHRGYWNTDGSAQNSLRALVKSDSIGCFASEFDVWMTADSVLVVNHDADINGVHIESSPSSVVLAERLANGETVPTLESYLAAAVPQKQRIVCELKTHDSRAHERMAIKAILAMMKKYGLEDRVDYITFSKDGFKELVKKAPKGTAVYYLSGDFTPAQVKFMKGAGIDYSLKVMKKHPEWIKQCHDLGLLVNVWTVNEPDDMQWCIDQGVDFITTNEPERLQQMLGKAHGENCTKCNKHK